MTPEQWLSLFFALLPLIITLCTILYKHLVARLPENKRQFVMSLASTAVAAVEQTARGLKSEEKKATAVQMIEAILTSLRISVPPTLIDASIEAYVHDMNIVKDMHATLASSDAAAIPAEAKVTSDVPL